MQFLSTRIPSCRPGGIRVGTPAVTTRGMREEEMLEIADFVAEALQIIADDSAASSNRVRGKVHSDLERGRYSRFPRGRSIGLPACAPSEFEPAEESSSGIASRKLTADRMSPARRHGDKSLCSLGLVIPSEVEESLTDSSA